MIITARPVNPRMQGETALSPTLAAAGIADAGTSRESPLHPLIHASTVNAWGIFSTKRANLIPHPAVVTQGFLFCPGVRR